MRATARARANIALVKYWGKADAVLNVPAVGSVSITLDNLYSETSVEFDASLDCDSLTLDGSADATALERVTACVDLLRERAGIDTRVRVVSRNNFPTGAGLASSASGFAALVAAGAAALDLSLSPKALSVLARRGSGSAARSVFGGYVEMHAGTRADGSDSFAEPLLEAAAWPLRVVVAITSRDRKRVGSTAAMHASAETSPYYPAWLATSAADICAAKAAIGDRDFAALGAVAERSCLKMHALAMSSSPPIIFWNSATIACIDAVRTLREDGFGVFLTIDAGPQVKVVCVPEDAATVADALRGISGVVDVVETGLGSGVEIC
jgi:diphosphomevalonate decarboxylase